AVRDCPEVRGQCEIHWVQSGSPTEFASQIEKLSRSCNAVAAVASDCHQVSHAVADARARGVAVFSMLSDFAQGIRESYVGTNNLKVGRAAAWMLARTARRAGKVGIFVGGHRWHGHELRETGFRSYFREHAPEFEVIETVTNLENRQLTYESTLDLLARHPDISGFYCAGGGMEGALEALREEGRGPDLSVIVNEVTPETKAGLEDGIISAVLSTPLEEMCRVVVNMMVRTVSEGMEETRGQVFLPARLYIPESL
ncbi:MAG: substrate-binding domain-containing protein, partial [Paracoccaceae bacterium]|nr:substrate-binding domain-containing protein [Paracoccaceae bacterium]